MKLVLRGSYPDGHLDFIRQQLTTDWRIEPVDPEDDKAAFAAALADADAVVAMSWSAAQPPAPDLRLLQLPGAGYDRIDFSAVPPNAVVCNVFEHEIGIAEYVLAGMLQRETWFQRLHEGLRRGSWADSLYTRGPTHGELFGKTLGIIGYGRIGQEVAKRARAFGVTVRACTRSPQKRDENVDHIAGMDGLDAMLPDCDYLLVACPLLTSTRGLMDARRFGLMKDSAVIINVARGEVIDEDALYAACRDRTIGGAIIDTWYIYPSGRDPDAVTFPSKHPFQDLDNVHMSPHSAGWTVGLWPRRWTVIAENMNRLARGEGLLNKLYEPGGAPPD